MCAARWASLHRSLSSPRRRWPEWFATCSTTPFATRLRGGTIWIEARLDASGTSAIVSVLDACGGIPEADLDHVFDMAYRGDTARTPGDGGAGLGLAVARGLVEAHHGQISVRNEGAGCRFSVLLPVSGSAERTAR